MFDWFNDRISFDDLIGKTIISINGMKEESEEVIIKANDDEGFQYIYKMYHRQDCCEDVYIEDVSGDVNDLIGQKVLNAYCESDNNFDEEKSRSFTKYCYEVSWTFYAISTIKGTVVLRWIGESESNGDYSVEVDFLRRIVNEIN